MANNFRRLTELELETMLSGGKKGIEGDKLMFNMDNIYYKLEEYCWAVDWDDSCAVMCLCTMVLEFEGV